MKNENWSWGSSWARLAKLLFAERTIIFVLSALLAVQIIRNQLLLSRSVSITPNTLTETSLIGIHVPIEPVQTLDGKLYEFPKDQRHLLVFFHTECRYCLLDIPLWNTLQQKALSQNMDIVAITLESDKDKVSRFMQDNNLKFPVVLDRDKSLFERFYVAVTPTKILLAPDSRVLHVWKGLTTQLSSSSELIDLIATFGVETQSLPMPPTSSTP